MPSITYRFAAFEPDLLHPSTGALIELPLYPSVDIRVAILPGGDYEQVLEISKQAPPEVEAIRRRLVTNGFTIPGITHDAFSSFHIIHDDDRYINAYRPTPDDGEDVSRETIRQGYVTPVRFYAYELNDQWGHLYATTSVNILKEMLRRYRSTTGNAGASLMSRKVDLRALRKTLREKMGVESSDLTFLNVIGNTALTRVAMAGPQLDDDDEIDHFDARAEEVGVFTFKYQHEDAIITITIRTDGSVKFSNDPQGASSLDLLRRLDGYIQAHSELVPVGVR